MITLSLFHLSPTSSYHYPLQVENCDSNSRLVVGEDGNGKFRLERVNSLSTKLSYCTHLELCIGIATNNKWVKITQICLI